MLTATPASRTERTTIASSPGLTGPCGSARQQPEGTPLPLCYVRNDPVNNIDPSGQQQYPWDKYRPRSFVYTEAIQAIGDANAYDEVLDEYKAKVKWYRKQDIEVITDEEFFRRAAQGPPRAEPGMNSFFALMDAASGGELALKAEEADPQFDPNARSWEERAIHRTIERHRALEEGGVYKVAGTARGVIIGTATVAGVGAGLVVAGLASPGLALYGGVALLGAAIGHAVAPRLDQGQTGGEVFWGTAADLTGVSGVYAGLYGRDIATGQKLQLNGLEQGEQLGAGGVGVVTTFLGAVLGVRGWFGRSQRTAGTNTVRNAGPAASVEGSAASRTIPQGLTRTQLDQAASLIRQATRNLDGDVIVHGSRAAGTARAKSDVDFAVRVSKPVFEEFVRARYGRANPGSNTAKEMRLALERGRVHAGPAGLRRLRTALEELLGMEVDISVIERGGLFDQGPSISVPY